MDMNKAFFLRNEDRSSQWVVIDAQGKILGRLATEIADILRGKHKTTFTPHNSASGDNVIVINAEKIVLTGKKSEEKEYARYTGWIGGYRVTTAKEMFQKHPTRIIEHAVKGMLPKNKLSRQLWRKLHIYAGPEHPHAAQVAGNK
jgi:large subunit ribosomal protein L13